MRTPALLCCCDAQEEPCSDYPAHTKRIPSGAGFVHPVWSPAEDSSCLLLALLRDGNCSTVLLEKASLRVLLPAVRLSQRPAAVLLLSTDATLRTSPCSLHQERKMYTVGQHFLVTLPTSAAEPGLSSSVSVPQRQVPGTELPTAPNLLPVTDCFQLGWGSAKSIPSSGQLQAYCRRAASRGHAEGLAKLRHVFPLCSSWKSSLQLWKCSPRKEFWGRRFCCLC